MKSILKRSKQFLLILSVTLGCLSCASSQDEELDIQDNFPFEVSVMPVPDEVANGQTVEIRFTIQPTGSYDNTHYFIRYFQFDGQGTLQYFDQAPYLPNDVYDLPELQFRLYYTSASTTSQSFDVWISDNFGNEQQVSFQFNSSD
ncbi:TraQ conjugal transfer family protein [Flavobacterium sp.]|uniref:TraQ conjugal transfer family protein n=1 Tax=Flavobacterium sp. TaxID=239 RepID=UPI004034A680